MDKCSDYINHELEKRNLSVKKAAEMAGMEYMQLYNSLLNKNRNRPLRASEYIALCKVLNLDPFGVQKNC